MNKKMIIIMFSVSVFILLIVFLFFKDAIICFIGAKFGIFPKDEEIIFMANYETLGNVDMFKKYMGGENVGHYDSIQVRPENSKNDLNSFILSKKRIRYIHIYTVDYPIGLVNQAFAMVDEKSSAPDGKVFKYSLNYIVSKRRCSKEVGIKFVSYNEKSFRNLKKRITSVTCI